jgi:hypothetical protein
VHVANIWFYQRHELDEWGICSGAPHLFGCRTHTSIGCVFALADPAVLLRTARAARHRRHRAFSGMIECAVMHAGRRALVVRLPWPASIGAQEAIAGSLCQK